MPTSLTELAQRLVQFETTHERPDQLEACFTFCIEYFAGYPVVVQRYEHEGVGSVVISTHDTKQLDVLLLGHVDTIPGSSELFDGRVEDGKLYGRGSLDMKAFVATSLATVRTLLDSGFAGKVGVMLVSDEEMGGVHGAKYLVNDIGYRADVILVPDDGEHINRIVEQSKHILHVEFAAAGVEAHGARPWMGKNAILQLYETYQLLAQHFPHFDTPPDDLWVNTINLGTISGGVATNEVPKDATMKVDIRFTPNITRAEVEQWINASLAPGMTYTVLNEGFPTVIDTSDSLVQNYAKVVESVTGEPVQYIKNGGATDGRYFAEHDMRVIVHQGTGGFCQTDEEHVVLDSLQQLVDIQTKFILENFSTPSEGLRVDYRSTR